MELKFSIHGVPKGQDYWGELVEDNDYLGQFYTKSREKYKLDMQLRKNSIGKMYAYYHYLVYDTVDVDMRSGGYFGMTLRIDAYCNDVKAIYNILEQIFARKILGSIIVKDGERYKYAIQGFEHASAKLNDIKSSLYNIIQNTFTGSEFSAIDSATKGSLSINPAELPHAVGKYDRIIVSPSFPMRKEAAMKKEFDERIAKKDVEKQAAVSEIESQKRQQQEANSKLQREIALKEAEITQLQREKQQLSNELQRVGKAKDISELVKNVEQPLRQLADKMPNMKNGIRTGANDRKRETKTNPVDVVLKNAVPFVTLIVSVMTLCLVVFSCVNIMPNDKKEEIPADTIHVVYQPAGVDSTLNNANTDTIGENEGNQ